MLSPARQVAYRFLFNFSASYSGGGLKRLVAYARWFSQRGGAWFAIHPRCGDLVRAVPGNRYFIVDQARFRRLYADCEYLEGIGAEVGVPALYYAFGIPMYARFGVVNWFHQCNVLPMYSRGIPLSVFDRAKLGVLGWKTRRTLCNADIVSAESQFSLALIGGVDSRQLRLSVLGSDDELESLRAVQPGPKESIATVVGTARYKSLVESYRVFEALKRRDGPLTLVIIGEKQMIPRQLRSWGDVVATGVLERGRVMEYLKRSRYYISTTLIEGSYNAASEGVFSANESYISDIGPHRELLANMQYERIQVPGVDGPVLHVRREDVSATNLKSWEEVITDIVRAVAERQGPAN